MNFSPETLSGSAVGLEIGNEAIRVIHLKRRFNRIRLAAFGEERMNKSLSEDEAVVQAIRLLWSRLKIGPKEAVLHVEGKGVRVLHLHAPSLSPGDLLHWLRDAFSKRFHAAVQSGRFAVSFHISGRDDKGFETTAAFCQIQELDKRTGCAEKAGLIPVAMGAGMLDAASAFASGDSGFFERTLAFVRDEGESAQAVITDKGNPVWQFSADKETMANLLADWQTETKKKIEKAVLLGAWDDDAAEKFKRSGFETETGSPLSGVLSGSQELPREFALAAGLALKRFFPLLNTIDLLPESKKAEARKQGDKQRAVRFLLAGGALILAFMLLLFAFKTVMVYKLDKQEEAMTAMGDRIVRMNLAKKETANLEKRISEMERLGNRRSGFAEILQEIGIKMTPSVWLEEISIKPGTPPKTKQAQAEPGSVSIQGWALDEEKAAALLAKLEGVRFLDRVRLVKTERIPADEVWQMSKVRKMDLVRFRIEGELEKTVISDQ